MIRVMEDIAAWIDSNSAIIESLERLLGSDRNAESKLDNRMYINRTDVFDED